MSEQLKRWSPTTRMEEIGKRPVGYMIGDKRGQWCWADIAEKQIATLTAERDALSAVLQQGADADVDLRKRYEALEKENAELRAQVARLSGPVSEEEWGSIWYSTARDFADKLIASRTSKEPA